MIVYDKITHITLRRKNMLSTIADIAGILSFIASIILCVLSHSIFKNSTE